MWSWGGCRLDGARPSGRLSTEAIIRGMNLKWRPFRSDRPHERVLRGLKSVSKKHGGRLLAGAALLSAAAAAVSGTGVYLFERAVRLRRRSLNARDQNAARHIAEENGALVENVQIEAADGTQLRSWYFRLHTDPRRAVLLLHGRTENRAAMLPYARLLLRHGYNVLCADHRGHGESGGEFSSYGLKEAMDVKRWVEWLKSAQAQEPVFALGRSMGATILLQSLHLKPGLAAVVAEAPFSSMREMAFDRVSRPLGAGSWLGRTLLRPVVESGIAWGRMRYGMDLGEATAEKSLAQCGIPVLLIHGEKDSVVPMRHASRLLECAGPLEFWRVPGCRHCRILSREPAEFERRITEWFQAPALAG